MWYRLDLLRFAWQMLPPMLRSQFLQALLRAFFIPLLWLYDRFSTLRSHAEIRLLSNGQAIAITDALRREFDTYEGDTYITDGERNIVYLYKKVEGQEPLRMHQQAERPTYLTLSDEGRYTADFYIHIPSFLQGYEEAILRIINHYKPAGRRYEIKFYEYE